MASTRPRLDPATRSLDESDAAESTTGGSRVKNLAEKIAAIRERRIGCKDILAQLDQNDEDQISLTDPDSRAMAAHTRVDVVQVAVDAKHKLSSYQGCSRAKSRMRSQRAQLVRSSCAEPHCPAMPLASRW
jgi:hypothetical protein